MIVPVGCICINANAITGKVYPFFPVILGQSYSLERLLTTFPPLPFPRAYWVLPGALLAGLYPGHFDSIEAEQKLRALLGCGIRKVINLMEPNERDYRGQPFIPYIERLRALAGADRTIAWARYPIPDGGLPSHEQMRAILDDIDASLAAGQPVYVHCWGGKGRTGTVIGCFLVNHYQMSGDAALQQITVLRQHIQPFQPAPENEAQCDFVRNWPVNRKDITVK